ncbi:MAG: AmmeMemoRadiSam system radical SAM enzyme [Spartobacteria bacterium]|nr:AmmeMemoRadiSam system radical SAM enzyme [Spartobacteria bacterium]
MKQTAFSSVQADGRVQCLVCPHQCVLKEGQRGRCRVRMAQGNHMVSTVYGLACGLAVDPIEKKPLNHFLPGTPVLSFGTAGCNLQCAFCQNASLSCASEMDLQNRKLSPAEIAVLARENGCPSVAFTYNDPVVFLEYAMDTACCCHEQGIRTVAVSAGFMNVESRKALYGLMDAANIDLKSFSDAFYRTYCHAELAPVLDTLRYVHHETPCWLEVTTLIIPGLNDGDDEIDAMTKWIYHELGSEVPLHFSGFYPTHKMLDRPPTSMQSLLHARKIALNNGLHYVYTGNVSDVNTASTYCHKCGELLIERRVFTITENKLDQNGCCSRCGTLCAGVFSAPLL